MFYTTQVIIPGWVWFVAAILHAASHHLDGMDGKQARRTGQSVFKNAERSHLIR